MTTGYRLDVPFAFAYTTAALQRTGAKLSVFANTTTTPISLYSDRACTVPAANPIVSVNGYFPIRFVAAAALHTLLWEDTDGTDRLTADNISPFQDSQQASANNQALDPALTAIAGLTISANKGIIGTGTDTFATFDLTAAALTFLALGDPNADTIYFWDDSAGAYVALTLPTGMAISGTSLTQDELWVIAVSDETTALTTGAGKASWVFPYAVTVQSVAAALNTASSVGIPTFDINEAGTTILSTKLTIDATELNSSTAATPPVISDAAIAAYAAMTVDIDVAGTDAKGAKVYMIVRRV